MGDVQRANGHFFCVYYALATFFWNNRFSSVHVAVVVVTFFLYV